MNPDPAKPDPEKPDAKKLDGEKPDGVKPGTRRIIRVVDYNLAWPEHFLVLRDRIWPSLSGLAVSIEHIGSTSVPGLAAKPIIDLDIVIPSRDDLPAVIERLAALGYEHQGDLGIPDREAFRWPVGESVSFPVHNLYVCHISSPSLRDHLDFRDHLRANPVDVAAYSALKKDLAARFPHDIDSYLEGKRELIQSMLAKYREARIQPAP